MPMAAIVRRYRSGVQENNLPAGDSGGAFLAYCVVARGRFLFESWRHISTLSGQGSFIAADQTLSVLFKMK